MFFSPQDLNYAPAAALTRVTPTSTTNTLNTSQPDPKVKNHLLLPNSSKGWEIANTFFEKSLVPAVLATPTPQEMNTILVEGVYSYFSTEDGTKKFKLPKKKHSPHSIPLKQVEKKKKAASSNKLSKVVFPYNL